MNARILALSSLLLASGFSSCSSAAKASLGLRRVDDLVTCIEHVQVESDVARDRLRSAVYGLHGVLDPKREIDVVSAFSEFALAIDQSEEQAAALRDAIGPMQKAAEPFFEKWQDDMEEFSSGALRERSRARMERTRERYDAIVAVSVPVQDEYDALNTNLRDHALFLGHDLNQASLDEIRGDVKTLTRHAAKVDSLLEQTIEACLAYAEASNLPQVEVTEEAPAEAK